LLLECISIRTHHCTTTTRESTPATFTQDRLGHVSVERARSLNIDGIPQPPTKMPKVKCPVCIASKPQHQHMTQDKHQDLGKTSIRISQAKCAYHP
jgi:hypothetical protein